MEADRICSGTPVKPQYPLASRKRRFYRATNPHSGCYFLSRRQALKVKDFWLQELAPDWHLSGPLEQACSGMLLPVMRLMKPIPEHYRFLMVRHQDSLWRRHHFEALEDSSTD